MQSHKKPKFPLPRGYFGKIEFTKEQEEYYRNLCDSQVQKGLDDERAFVEASRRVDKSKWKPVRSQHAYKLYRRRDGGLYEKDGKPSMIGVGRVEGSIEDVLYGAYDQTDEELRLTAGLIEVDFGDGFVLKTLERGSPSDPYRTLGIKWILTPFPVPLIMPDRDWILLESMGISTDSSGRRYGYHTLYTVELEQVPVFPEVIRGVMWFTFIYRDAGDGTIDVHSQGYFDCLGDLIDPLTVVGSSQMFNGVFQYMKAAEAKKLTILALESLENKLRLGLPTVVDESTLPVSVACSICTKPRSTAPFSSRRMRACRICDAVVCMNCRVKKNILVGSLRVQSKVSVCHRCIAHAKTLAVNPTDNKYEISRELRPLDRNQATSYRSQNSSNPGRSVEQASVSDEDGEDESWSPFSHDSPRSFHEETTSPRYRRTTASDASAVLLVPRVQSFAETTEGPRGQSLFDRMKELHLSAKRAEDLTEASRAVMLANNVQP